MPSVKHATRQIVAAFAVALALAGVSAASQCDPQPRVTIGPDNGDHARVYGCTMEDDCAIDYRGDRHGRGVWIITREAH